MSAFTIYVVSPPGYGHAGAFTEVAETLHLALRDLGHESRLTRDPDEIDGQAIVLGANLLVADHAAQRKLPETAILYNLEQIEPGSAWMSAGLVELYRQYRVFDYSAQNVERLRDLGVTDVGLLEIGYHPSLRRIPNRAQDIDVLFYGSLNHRRAQVLNELQQKGVVVHHLFGAYGSERDAAIARSKIVLNMHFYEAKVFEMVRVSYLLANERFVVSESGPESPLETEFAGGLVFGDHDKLVQICEHYLARPQARAAVAERGFDLMSRRLQANLLDAALAGVPA